MCAHGSLCKTCADAGQGHPGSPLRRVRRRSSPVSSPAEGLLTVTSCLGCRCPSHALPAREVTVGALSRWLFSFFLSTWGVAILAALDSSVLFSLPFALDVAVIILVAQHRALFWLYPLIVIPASLVGAASTYWVGRKLGEEGLERFVHSRRLKNVKRRVHHAGAIALAALNLLPPPFPFTAVLLMSGALGVDARRFFLTLAGVRVVRFGLDAVLALYYGTVIVSWLESETVRTIAGALIVLVVVGAVVSSYQLLRSTSERGSARSVRA